MNVDRFCQWLLIVSTVLLSWLGMMIAHEFGHCLCAWLSGGGVEKVVLHPLAISRTDVTPNPHPLFVAWGGPVIGVLLPLVILVFMRLTRLTLFYLFQFFAGFCLVVNGFYIAEDSFFLVADSGDLIGCGTPRWIPVAFGIVTVSLGLCLWNGLGPYFGLGEAKGKVSRRAALGALIALLSVVLVEIAVSCGYGWFLTSMLRGGY